MKIESLEEYIDACQNGEFEGKDIYLVCDNLGEYHLFICLSGKDSTQYEMNLELTCEEVITILFGKLGSLRIHWK